MHRLTPGIFSLVALSVTPHESNSHNQDLLVAAISAGIGGAADLSDALRFQGLAGDRCLALDTRHTCRNSTNGEARYTPPILARLERWPLHVSKGNTNVKYYFDDLSAVLSLLLNHD